MSRVSGRSSRGWHRAEGELAISGVFGFLFKDNVALKGVYSSIVNNTKYKEAQLTIISS